MKIEFIKQRALDDSFMFSGNTYTFKQMLDWHHLPITSIQNNQEQTRNAELANKPIEVGISQNALSNTNNSSNGSVDEKGGRREKNLTSEMRATVREIKNGGGNQITRKTKR